MTLTTRLLINLAWLLSCTSVLLLPPVVYGDWTMVVQALPGLLIVTLAALLIGNVFEYATGD